MKPDLFLLFSVVGLLAACSPETKNSSHPAAVKPEAAVLALDSISESVKAPAPTESTELAASLALQPGAATKTIYQLLQGKWRSAGDDQYVLELKGHRYLDYYGGKLSDSTEFILDKACPSAPEAGHPGDNERYLVQPKEDMCWEIVGVDEESLELIYTSRGNTLSFKRIR
ncbi:hypothetical protein [Hymenobacter volaticus]|uniref:Lipocalin-like domain-containing protein n=1 Tax=Hymenobacter volaticus TaxID=2932254 RepID=A0ABY4GEA7_9BACT|nr:hypothetical protein [Hymenobacter volaticus]UOQ68739.1 hypothetical protein MUN86_23800 [Hymenobacter volaticus]